MAGEIVHEIGLPIMIFISELAESIGRPTSAKSLRRSVAHLKMEIQNGAR